MYRKFLIAAVLLGMLCLGAAAQAEEPADAQGAPTAKVHFEDFNAFVKENAGVRFYGTLECGEPMLRVEARCYDLRRLETLGEYSWAAQEGEEVFRLPLYDMRRPLFPVYRTGDYRVTIDVYTESGVCTALDQRMFIAGEQLGACNMNEDCEISCSEKRTWIWSDCRLWSEWTPQSEEDILRVTLPEGRSAEGISVQWQRIPSFARITSYSAGGELLSELLIDDTGFTPLNSYYPLSENAASFAIEIPQCDASISEMLVIEKDRRAQCVQVWRDTAEKWDMMLISTHQDDEHLFFGGMIAETVAQGRELGVVYMVDCGYDRYLEALDGLWAAGMSNYPVFLGFRDGIIDTKGAAYTYWGGDEPVLEALVEQIRRYKPEVIVTHDFNGEYDNNQHKVVAECTASAVAFAADPAYHPESAELYGTWQAKKLYIHLYEENEIVFDWDKPVEGFGGLTGYDISRMSYSFHRSQQKWVDYSLGLAYDPYRFGLYYTSVGPDTGAGSLFEHID